MTAPWTDAELDDLARDYPADAHADVAALIAGARAVVALHRPEDDPSWVCYPPADCCEACCPGEPNRGVHVPYPCATVRALSLEESP